MGAKTWMLVYAAHDPREAQRSSPRLNRDATQVLANKLFPRDTLELVGDGDLSYTCPPDDEIHIGQFSGVSVVAAKEFGTDCPSRLSRHFITEASGGSVYLHAMHSVVDWFAYALWRNGTLVRSLSLSPDSGILEDIGQRLPFEEPYWSGQHPAVDSEEDEDAYPFPFHPLELGEAALADLFGYHLEGLFDESLFGPESVPLLRFKRSPRKRGLWGRLWH